MGCRTKQDKDMPDGMEIVAVIVSEEVRSRSVEQTFCQQEYHGVACSLQTVSVRAFPSSP